MVTYCTYDVKLPRNLKHFQLKILTEPPPTWCHKVWKVVHNFFDYSVKIFSWNCFKERVMGWSRITQLSEFLYYRYTLLPSYDLQCGMMTSQEAAKSTTGWYPWERLDLSSFQTAGHSWEVIYSWNREILKGGGILDQPLTWSLP